MIENTKAFILSYLKYGDSSLIVKCYTERFGFRSFILKGSFSKKQKKNHRVFLLNEVEITFYTKKYTSSSLELIKDIQQGYLFNHLHTHIVKTSIITFIGEILNQVLRNEEMENSSLYIFLKDNLMALDRKENYFADFHLYFLLKLSKYIGFSPLPVNSELPFFNIREGIFSLKNYNLSKSENGFLWDKLLAYNFSIPENCFDSLQRKYMLEEVISYYELHLDNFKKPISLDILKVLFN